MSLDWLHAVQEDINMPVRSLIAFGPLSTAMEYKMLCGSYYNETYSEGYILTFFLSRM